MVYACHYGTKEVVEFVMNRVSYNPSVTDAYMNTICMIMLVLTKTKWK